MSEASAFTVGGTVQAGSGLYIERRADERLFRLCDSMQFAYVLTPRQMGKSSLMVRTAERLADSGIQSVMIDLSQIGVQSQEEDWYLSVLTAIEDRLDLETDAYDWWKSQTGRSAPQRFVQFLKEVVLSETPDRVVIFLDEIDTTLSLKFDLDDFFASIRSIYNSRSQTKVFERLSFVLIGVATPNDLISDPQRTPFNIGERVLLSDFSDEEVTRLSDGLPWTPDVNARVIRHVTKWTGGHPYLTQRMCRAVVSLPNEHVSEADVDAVARDVFLESTSGLDNNLEFVRDMLTKRVPAAVNPADVLNSFKLIVKGRPPVRDDEQSIIKSHLKLSGVAIAERGVLRVRNAIYASAFGSDWIAEQLRIYIDWRQRLKTALVASGILLAVIAVGLSIWASVGWSQARQAVGELSTLTNELWRANTSLTETSNSLNQSTRDLEGANADLQESLKQISDYANSLTVVTNQLLQKSEELQRQMNLSETNRLLAETNYVEAVRARERTQAANLLTEQNLFESFINRATLLARSEAYVDAQNGLRESLEIERNISPRRKVVRNWLARYSDLMGLQSTEIYDEQDAPLRDLCLTPDGKGLVAAGEQGKLFFVDLSSGEATVRNEHTDTATQVVAHPNKKLIVSGGRDRQLIVWSMPEGKVLRRWKAPSSINGMAISEDYLATAGADDIVTLWNLETGAPQHTFRGHTDTVTSLAISPDQQWLASASYDRSVRLWHLDQKGKRGGRQTRELRLAGHDDHVLALSFHPHLPLLASGGADHTVRIWDLESESLADTSTLFRGHQNGVLHLGFVQLGDSTRLLSASLDRDIRVWDIESGVTLRVLSGHDAGVTAMAVQGETLYSCSLDQAIHRWELSGAEDGAGIEMHDFRPRIPQSVALHPDDLRSLAVGFSSGGVAFIGESKLSETNILSHGASPVPRLAFSRSGEALVSVGFDGAVKQWSTRNGLGGPVHVALRSASGFNGVAFLPAGDSVVCVGGKDDDGLQGILGLINIRDGSKQWVRTESELLSCAVSDSGRSFLTTSSAGKTRLWSVAEIPNSLGIEILEDEDQVTWAGFRPGTGENEIAVVGRSGKGLLYNRTTQRRLELPGHQNTILKAAFDPLGLVLLTVGADATIRVWDLEDAGNELIRLRLPAKRGSQVPVWDFDFRVDRRSGDARIAVPLTNGQLVTYRFPRVYPAAGSEAGRSGGLE